MSRLEANLWMKCADSERHRCSWARRCRRYSAGQI